MTTESESVPPSVPPILPIPPNLSPSLVDWEPLRRCAKMLLARNPFYIASAGLLVWSMRRLSLDSRIFSGEFPQLLFNLSSFQVYEALLVGTAILLARRRIWYDAGLLVGLENLFICVPFLLVSQALLLENRVALALCLAGGAFATLRVAAWRKRLPHVNLPASLLAAGGVLLTFNLGWPALIRHLHESRDLPMWDNLGLTLNQWEWSCLLPTAVALAWLLPRRGAAAAMEPGEETPLFAWRSFPFLTLCLWAAGTAVHLYCISFVYGLPWEIAFLAPAAWMMAWALWRQRENLALAGARRALETILLLAPASVTLVTACLGRGEMTALLAGLNVAAYGILAWRRRERFTLHLPLVSAALTAAFMPWPHPVNTVNRMEIPADMNEILWASALIYMVGWALLSDRARVGIFGGICLAIGLAFEFPARTASLNLAAQIGLIFMLLHSMRWTGENAKEIARARILCGAFWLTHSILWVAWDPASGVSATMACGAATAGLYAAARAIQGKWGPRAIWLAALAVSVCGPVFMGGQLLRRAPDGLLILGGSFVLFGFGTFAALRKKSWGAPQVKA